MSIATLAEPLPLEPSPKLTAPFGPLPRRSPNPAMTDGSDLPSLKDFINNLCQLTIDCDGSVSATEALLINQAAVLYSRYLDRVRIEAERLHGVSPGSYLLTWMKAARAIGDTRRVVIRFLIRDCRVSEELAEEYCPGVK